jgi:SHS2 domain-containing protein
MGGPHPADRPRAPGWRHFRHEADMGVEGVGARMEEAFEQAALAITAIVTDPERVRDGQVVEVRCEAPDPELLLAAWLNAVVFEMATRRMLFRRFRVQISGQQLIGTLWGEPLVRDRHRPAVEVKGATYTELSVRRRQDGCWQARCVVDV